VEGAEEIASAAVSEAYRRARAFWFTDRWPAEVVLDGPRTEGQRHFQVLTIRPRAGRSFDLWVDDGTDLPDRTVQQEGADLRTTFYSDYRVVPGTGGLKIPYVSRSTTGNEKYDTVARTTAVEVNPAVAAAAYALPAPPKPDSGFEGNARSATVPFEFLNGHVYLSVKLNGQGPFRFGFDSGGMNLVVPRVARALGLSTAGTIEGTGVGEQSEDVAVARIDRVDIGPVYLQNQTFFEFPLQKLDAVAGVQLDGLIGYEVFRRFIVRFDYDSRELTFSDPASWKYAGTAPPVPFVFNEHVPQVDGEIDGIAGQFDIDTGSHSSIDLLGPFVREHGLVERYKAGAEIITGWGAGGPARGRVVRAGELRLGPVTVRAPVAVLSAARRGSFASEFVAGNVGSGVLRRFDITFDYGAQRIFFEPNRQFGDADSYDRAGMWVNLADHGGHPVFEVVEVVPGGPAEQAGIRAGERITRVNGVSAGRVGLPAFRARMRESAPGTRIELRVAGDKRDKNVLIVLRDLV
jgi:hypothetical protein